MHEDVGLSLLCRTSVAGAESKRGHVVCPQMDVGRLTRKDIEEDSKGRKEFLHR